MICAAVSHIMRRTPRLDTPQLLRLYSRWICRADIYAVRPSSVLVSSRRQRDRRDFDMQFLTQILNRKLIDSVGDTVGKVQDVIVAPFEPLPIVAAISVRSGHNDVLVPWSQVREEVDRLSLPIRSALIPGYQPPDGSIWLRRDVLDRQIVDMHDYKVVRVNDVRFVETPGEVRLLGVDASTRGLLRELGLDWLAKIFKKRLTERIIAWNDVETLEISDGPIKLKTSLSKLSKLHPSDIADIIEQMNPMQRADVIGSLDVQTAADVLPEASAEIQAEIIEDMDTERASDILEEMDPDEAADILGDISEERSEQILREMQPDEAEDVRELLSYEDETAGGLMTTDYLAIPDSMTAQGTIDYLRSLSPDAETIYYLYVVTELEKLVGVISLRDLIISPPDRPISDFMVRRLIKVSPDASQREVAEVFQKYNLLALPVVDDIGEILGIITIDDTIEDLPVSSWHGRKARKQSAPDRTPDYSSEA